MKEDFPASIKTIDYRLGFKGRLLKIIDIFTDVVNLFSGKFPGYLSCDTKFHDLQHTIETSTLTFLILLSLYVRKLINENEFKAGVIAAIMHDTGYIKKIGDSEGTGAKYTFEHIERSCAFVQEYFRNHPWVKLTKSIQNIIRCTGISVDITKIHFKSNGERLAGFALGSADLLSQMASKRYPNMPSILFDEYAEAYQYVGIDRLQQNGARIFLSGQDLIENTPNFWEFTQIRLDNNLGGVYKYLPQDIINGIFNAINNNIRTIQTMITRSIP